MIAALRALPRTVFSRVRPRAASIRSRQFWLTQALVLFTVATIYAADNGASAPRSGNGVPFAYVVIVVFSLLSVLYAALGFGLEGGVLTALWIGVLAGPRVLLGAGDLRTWLMESALFVTVLLVGTILAVRVERERDARQRLEALSRRLTLLHELGQSLSRVGGLPDLLEDFVRSLRDGLDLSYVSISYREEDDAEPLVIDSGDRTLIAWLTGDAAASGAQQVRAVDVSVVPLTAEQAFFGMLGVAREGRPLSPDEREVLAIASLEASASLEVRQLEARRRDALTLYARQVTRGHEEERARIARELHDGVVQVLSGLVRAIDLVQQRWGKHDRELGASVEELRRLSSDALAELRRVTRDLRPVPLERLGLQAALRSLAGQLTERTGMRVDLHFGEPAPLPTEVELCIFRVVQEALTNVEKHAHATAVQITLAATAERVRVEVQDDGIGGVPPVDVSELARRGQFGLLGMTERAALVGGTIETAPRASGTSIVLSIPLPAGAGAGREPAPAAMAITR